MRLRERFMWHWHYRYGWRLSPRRLIWSRRGKRIPWWAQPFFRVEAWWYGEPNAHGVVCDGHSSSHVWTPWVALKYARDHRRGGADRVRISSGQLWARR